MINDFHEILWHKNFTVQTAEHKQVSRSSSVPPNMRDALYQGLPPSIKSALRNKLQSFQLKEEVSIVASTSLLHFQKQISLFYIIDIPFFTWYTGPTSTL